MAAEAQLLTDEAVEDVPVEWREERKEKANVWFTDMQSQLLRERERQTQEIARQLKQLELDRQEATERQKAEEQRYALESSLKQLVLDHMDDLRIYGAQAEGKAQKSNPTVNPVMFPHFTRVASVVVLYSPNASMKERVFTRGLVCTLKTAGLGSSVWFDLDERMYFSRKRSLSRLEALERCKVAVVVLSRKYAESNEFHWESLMMRYRQQVPDWHGSVKVVPVYYGQSDPLPQPEIHAAPGDPTRLVTDQGEGIAVGLHQDIEVQIQAVMEHLQLQLQPLDLAIKPNFKVVFNNVECDKDDTALLWALAQRIPFSFLTNPVEEWTAYDTQMWLQTFGASFAKYSPRFLQLHIDGWCLPYITYEEMAKDLKVTSQVAAETIWSRLRRFVIRARTFSRTGIKQLQDLQGEGGSVEDEVLTMSQQQQLTMFQELYYSFDKDRDGVLDFKEFKRLLSSPQLRVPEGYTEAIFEEVDCDADQLVSLDELVGLMWDLIIALVAFKDANTWFTEDCVEDAHKSIHGMPYLDLQKALQQCVAQADTSGVGHLSLTNLRKMLVHSGLQLSPMETNLILHRACSMAGDSLCVPTRDFGQWAVQLLHQYRRAVQREVYGPNGQVELLLSALKQVDPECEEKGWISFDNAEATVCELARRAWQLGQVQLFVLMSVTATKGDKVDIHTFLPLVAHMLYVMQYIKAQLKAATPKH